VISSSYTEAGSEVVQDSPDGSLELERDPESLDAAIDGNAHDESDVEPVDMLVPVRSRHRGFGDVRFLGVIFGVPVRL